MKIKQTIIGHVPSKSNSYKLGKTKNGTSMMFKSKSLTKYERDFFIQLDSKLKRLNYDDLFELDVNVYFRSMRSDLDNSLKIILDCLECCGVIKNDNKCFSIKAKKHIDKNNPRIEFKIYSWK